MAEDDGTLLPSLRLGNDISTTMARHRGHGDGSVYERKAKGDWCAQLTLPTGKRKTIGYGRTKREAQTKLRAAQPLLQQGKLPYESTRLTLKEHLRHWLETVAKPSISYHTYEAYEISIRRRLIPLLGHLRCRMSAPITFRTATRS